MIVIIVLDKITVIMIEENNGTSLAGVCVCVRVCVCVCVCVCVSSV